MSAITSSDADEARRAAADGTTSSQMSGAALNNSMVNVINGESSVDVR